RWPPTMGSVLRSRPAHLHRAHGGGRSSNGVGRHRGPPHRPCHFDGASGREDWRATRPRTRGETRRPHRALDALEHLSRHLRESHRAGRVQLEGNSMSYHAEVDHSICTGYAECARIAPEAFKLNENNQSEPVPSSTP